MASAMLLNFARRGIARNYAYLKKAMSTTTVKCKSKKVDDDIHGDVPAPAPSHQDGTTITLLNRDKSILMIDTYSQLGFRLNNNLTVIGPMAIFPRTVLSWNVSGIDDVDEESLSLFCLLEPKLDVLIVGVGDKENRLDPRIFKYLQMKKIGMEVLPTAQACATFNFLNSERRYVAAAMIPPKKISFVEDDIAAAKTLSRRKLFDMKDSNLDLI